MHTETKTVSTKTFFQRFCLVEHARKQFECGKATSTLLEAVNLLIKRPNVIYVQNNLFSCGQYTCSQRG